MPRTNRPYLTGKSSPLAQLRVRAALNRAAAAAQLEISVPRLGNIEHGVRASDELLERMAGVYGVSALAVRRAYNAGRREFLVREGP